MPPNAAGAVRSALANAAQQHQQRFNFENAQEQLVQGTARLGTTVITRAPPKVVVHASFVIDASGSMSLPTEKNISRMEAVLNYVKQMAQELCPTDRITLAFFNTRYKQIWHNTLVSTILEDFDRVRKAAQDMLGDQTKLWDCTEKALSSMQKTETGVKDNKGNTILRFMVVFTDGEDNASKIQQENIVGLLVEPSFKNFNFVCVVVGAPSTAAELQQAFQNVKRAEVIAEAECSAAAIQKAFGRASQALRQARTKLVEKLVIILENEHRNAQPAMRDLISSFAGSQGARPGSHRQSVGRGQTPSSGNGQIVSTPTVLNRHGLPINQLVSIFTGHQKCVDIAHGSAANGAVIQQYASNGTNAQKFYLRDAGDGYVYIRDVIAERFVDVAGNSTAPGAHMHMWSFHGGDNQMFKFVKYPNGTWQIRPKSAEHMAWEVSEERTNLEARITLQNKKHTGTKMFFNIVPV